VPQYGARSRRKGRATEARLCALSYKGGRANEKNSIINLALFIYYFADQAPGWDKAGAVHAPMFGRAWQLLLRYRQRSLPGNTGKKGIQVVRASSV